MVVDSSSTDRTVEIARQMGADTVVIPKKQFNHGLTREMARRRLNSEIVVFLTQDAYLAGPEALDKLIGPIVRGEASVTYARQLPHEGAGFFESFLREFNYPSGSQLRSAAYIEKYGIYTCFCSDSCAAYNNGALDEIGGFPETAFGEDAIVAAKLLLGGHSIAYVAEAEVRHSHGFSLIEEFKRHYHTGLYRKKHQSLFLPFGTDKQRGMEYVQQLLKKTVKEKPWLVPYAMAQITMKAAGYYLGRIDF